MPREPEIGTENVRETLIVIDGSYQLNRFYHGVPKAASLPDGTIVNAVYGFIAYLRRLLGKYPSAQVFVVFDSESGIAPKLRTVPGYKQNRVAPDGDMFAQMEMIKQVLRFLKIRYVEMPDHEADDVICSLVRRLRGKFRRIHIASHDADFYQLLDGTTSVLKEVRGVQVEVGERDFVEANGIRPDQYALFLALRGDSSDNIKGVPGIGRVTARKLLRKYGTLENLLGDQSPGSVALAAGYGRYLRETTSFLKMKDDVDIPGLGVEELHGRYAGMLDRRTNELLALSGYEKCFSRGPDSPGPGTPEVG